MSSACLARILLASFVATSVGNEFLKGPPKVLNERLSEDEIRTSILEEVEGTFGVGSVSNRLEQLERVLKPMYIALPKNENNRLAHSTVRHALHRLFVLRHGWDIRGLGGRRGIENTTSSVGVLKDKVPAYIQELFEKRLGGKGLDLHDLSVFASAIEHLIHTETVRKLGAAFEVHKLLPTEMLTESAANEVLDTYMTAFILGENLMSMTLEDAQSFKKDMPEVFGHWAETQNFVSEIRKNVTKSSGREGSKALCDLIRSRIACVTKIRMGGTCKICCVTTGIVLVLGFTALLIAGVVEKQKFDPFYRHIGCPEVPLAIPLMRFSLPPQMLPPGAPLMSPPYGLYGSILNTTSTCHNPNEVKVTTKKSNFESILYVPDGDSYIKVASGHLKEDYVLSASAKGTSLIEHTANTSITHFVGLFQTVLLAGYSPLYTKTVSTSDSCIKLFGLEFCGKKDTITWCGVLAGNCQTEVELGVTKVWVPGLCAYTRTICRLGGEKGEAEMKSLVTADKLGLSTIDLPCGPQTGLPVTMNCPIAQAPGINATLHQKAIYEIVDGPFPAQEDIDDAKSAIMLATNIVITVAGLGIFIAGFLSVACVWCPPTRAISGNPTSAPDLPSILTSDTTSKGATMGTTTVVPKEAEP